MGFNPGLSPALRGREPTPKNLKLMLMGGCRTGLHWVPPGLILASPPTVLKDPAASTSPESPYRIRFPVCARAFPFLGRPEHTAGFWISVQTQLCENYSPSRIGFFHGLRKRLGGRLALRMHKKKSQEKVTKATYM